MDQKTDPKIKAWFDYILEGVLPADKIVARRMAMERPNIAIVDGVVKRRTVAQAYASRKDDVWLTLVPENRKSEVLKAFHEDSGHGSGARMASLIHQAGMDWEQCYAECIAHADKCTCKKFTKI